MPLVVNRNWKEDFIQKVENNVELQKIVSGRPFRKDGHGISEELFNLLSEQVVKDYLNEKHGLDIEVDIRWAQTREIIGYRLKIRDFQELNKLKRD
jgi:hypothetical protein